MGPIILRPGQRIIAPEVRVIQPSMVAAVNQWWLSGGISASNCVAAYQPKGAADLASSYINLANPGTFNAAPGIAPTFAGATGWTFNGTTQYLTTGVVPASGWSVVARFSGGSSAFDFRMITGVYNGATVSFGLMQNNSLNKPRYYSGGNANGATAITSGVMAVAGQVGYKNGSSDTGAITAWTGSVSTDIVLGALRRQDTSTIEFYFSGNIQAISIYNISIASYVSALTTAINAL